MVPGENPAADTEPDWEDVTLLDIEDQMLSSFRAIVLDATRSALGEALLAVRSAEAGTEAGLEALRVEVGQLRQDLGLLPRGATKSSANLTQDAPTAGAASPASRAATPGLTADRPATTPPVSQSHEWLGRHVRVHPPPAARRQKGSPRSTFTGLMRQLSCGLPAPSAASGENTPASLAIGETCGQPSDAGPDLEQGTPLAIVSGVPRTRRTCQWMHGRLKWAVNSLCFDVCACVLVVVHAALVGAHTDLVARHGSDGQLVRIFNVCESVFCVVFASELMLRLAVNGLYFFHMPGWQWNLFDCCIIILQLVDQLTVASVRANVSFLRMVRVFRLFRAIRVVREMRLGWVAARELRTIVTSTLSSLKFLMCAIVMLSFVIYIVGIYYTQVVADHLSTAECKGEHSEECKQLYRYFGSLSRTILTLFQSITGGVDWDDVVVPLSHISPMLALTFSMYIVFAVLALLNVTTGVFVEASLKSATADRDCFMINNVRKIFQANTTCNAMTWDKFVVQLDTPEMRAYFKAIDLDPSEARGLFRLLDIDGSGSVDAEEFLNGCLRLRGPAKALDLALVMREMHRMHRQFDAHLGAVEQQLMDSESLSGSCSSMAPRPTLLTQQSMQSKAGAKARLGSVAGMIEFDRYSNTSMASTASDFAADAHQLA